MKQDKGFILVIIKYQKNYFDFLAHLNLNL